MRFGIFIVGIGLALAGAALAAETRGLSVKLRASEAKDAAIIETVELYSKSYALVIGNDNYRDGWARLGQARNDARKVATALKARGFEVTLKMDLKAAELEGAFKGFFLNKGDDPNARLFVWYAGHGHTEDGEGYLVPVDGTLPSKRKKFLSTALSLRRFGEFVRLAESKHVFTIFDSCFAGTIFNVARANDTPPQITRITTQPVRQFLTSGDAGQTVADNGTFADLFIEALAGQRRSDPNADGYLTASELGAFLDSKMSNLTNNRQTPRYGKLQDKRFDKGDFVFQLASVTPSRHSRESGNPGFSANAEVVFWQSIQKSTDEADFQAYLGQYPNGSFAALARNRLASLTSRPSISTEAPKNASFADTASDAFEQARPAWTQPATSEAAQRNFLGQMEIIEFQIRDLDALVKNFDASLKLVESGKASGARVTLEGDKTFDILHELARLDARLGGGRCFAFAPNSLDYGVARGGQWLTGRIEKTLRSFRDMCGRIDKLIADVRYRVQAIGLNRDKKVASLGTPVRFIAVTPLRETRVAVTKSNIRREPSPRTESLGQLNAGETVQVTGRADVGGKPWYRIALSGNETGYVLGRLLKEVSSPRVVKPSTSNTAVGVYPSLTPGKTFRDCPDCPEMVVIPPGRFEMGGDDRFERPIHEVEISYSFAVGKFEITRGEYEAFEAITGREMGNSCQTYENDNFDLVSNRNWRNPGTAQSSREPVVCVDWGDAKAYVAWLSRKTKTQYRLLSEAEWEYMARAGGSSRYPFNSSAKDLCKLGNIADLSAGLNFGNLSCRDGYVQTAPAGSFKANAFGVYDIVGNVMEWVEDCRHDNYVGAPSDGSAWTTGDDYNCSYRVSRSSSWSSSLREVRLSYRQLQSMKDRLSSVGFRVARTLSR